VSKPTKHTKKHILYNIKIYKYASTYKYVMMVRTNLSGIKRFRKVFYLLDEKEGAVKYSKIVFADNNFQAKKIISSTTPEAYSIEVQK